MSWDNRATETQVDATGRDDAPPVDDAGFAATADVAGADTTTATFDAIDDRLQQFSDAVDRFTEKVEAGQISAAGAW